MYMNQLLWVGGAGKDLRGVRVVLSLEKIGMPRNYKEQRF